MIPWALPIAIPAGIALFLVNWESEARFQEFCRLIARREGRLPELLGQTYEDIDNAFEEEQRARLKRQDYQVLGDNAITALGDRLVQRSRLLLFVNVAGAAVLVLLVALGLL